MKTKSRPTKAPLSKKTTEPQWLKMAAASLESLRANVFIANLDLEIVYINPCAVQTLCTLAGEISRVFNIYVKEILGASIHTFHKGVAAGAATSAAGAIVILPLLFRRSKISVGSVNSRPAGSVWFDPKSSLSIMILVIEVVVLMSDWRFSKDLAQAVMISGDVSSSSEQSSP